jgi:competence protein ComEC
MVLPKSKKFFYGCLAFLSGIALGEVVHWPLYVFLIILFVFVDLSFFLKKWRLLWVLFFIFASGVFWNNLLMPIIDESHISFYNDQEITFQAVIITEPDSRLDHQKLTVSPTDYKGKVLLKMFLYPEYEYGDLLEIKCRLVTPEPIEEFKYDRYLARYGIYSVCYYPGVHLLDKGQGNSLMSGVLKLKKSVETKINQTISEPQASLTAGILIGSRQGIPKDLLEKFNITGITHIIAISGFNITIIVVLLMNLSKHFYIDRKKMIWIIGACLLLFVFLTGASASVVRAAIMGMIVIFAKHIGRLTKVSNLLILSAVLMVVVNPKILVWDAGFQLSFFATIGLVYLSPVLEKYFTWLPKKLAIRENTTSTLSSIIFTLPMILFSFHRLSIVAPLVNLLVLPIIPLAMFLGFFQIVAAYLSPFLGQMVGWFTWLSLSYVIKMVEIFSSFTWASIGIRINWIIMISGYLILFRLIIFNKKKEEAR